jgi:hypothetical protein
MALQIEFPFTLPKGYVDPEGNMHKTGTMRLATAADEILPMKDPRIQQNPPYLSIIVLSRVIGKLGQLDDISPDTIEGLFIGDLGYLQEFYRRINGDGSWVSEITCPHCKKSFKENVANPGL